MLSRFISVGLLALAFTINLPTRVAAQIYVCAGDECGAYSDLQELEERANARPNDPVGFLRVGVYYFDEVYRGRANGRALSADDKRLLITKGVEAIDRALILRPNYVEALTYKSLLLRLQATVERDVERQKALASDADELTTDGRGCQVTVPNGSGTFVAPPPPGVPPPTGVHGNRLLHTYLVWPTGTIVFRLGGWGFTESDGSVSLKFGWQQAVRGELTVQGRRLDAPAPPLRQSSGLNFPTPGCWEVTAQVGDRKDSRLTFTVRVVKIGNGPTGYPAHDIARRAS